MKSFEIGLAFTFLLLAVRPSWTMEDVPSSSPVESSPGNMELESEIEPDALLGFELQDNPVKRAYTYVSEYKRLPIYNFGLGKRWGISGGNNADEEKRARLYSFGLGKRARPYSFGLGKRGGGGGGSSSSNSIGVDSSPFVIRGEDYEELGREPVDDYLEKRSRLYGFGLGKRIPGDNRGEFGSQRFNFGLGKRPSDDFGHRYKFGLGKRRLSIDEDAEQQQNLASS